MRQRMDSSPSERIRKFGAKLTVIASSDAYFATDPRVRKGQTQFQFRDAARQALAPAEIEDSLSYVTRTADSRECRVQPISDAPLRELFIAPVSDAKRQMCSHYDPVAKDPLACWLIYPRNACVQ